MRPAVVFVDDAQVVGHELVVGVGRLLVGVVVFVVDLLLARAVGFQPGVPAADARLQTLLDAVFLGTVEVLGALLLRVAGVAPPHEREDDAGANQPVGEVVDQVVLDLHLGRAIPALAVDEPEHAAHAVDEQVGRLEAAVCVADDAARSHIVGVVSLDTGAVGHLARQVAVVERNLRESPHRSLAAVVRTVAVVEVPGAVVEPRAQGAVLGVVQVIGHGGGAQGHGLAVAVGELPGVEQLARLGVVDVELAAHELVVHLGHRGVERTLGQAVERENQPLGLVVHLAGILVAELARNQRFVAHAAELGDLLAEAQGTLGQRMAVLLPEVGHGRRHLAPLHAAVELRLAQGPGVGHEPLHGPDHRSVDGVFGDFARGQRVAVVEAEAREERAGLGIERVVVAEPLLQLHDAALRVAFPGRRPVLVGQAVENHQRAASAAAPAGHLQLAARRQLPVVGGAHHLQQFTDRDAEYVVVVFHGRSVISASDALPFWFRRVVSSFRPGRLLLRFDSRTALRLLLRSLRLPNSAPGGSLPDRRFASAPFRVVRAAFFVLALFACFRFVSRTALRALHFPNSFPGALPGRSSPGA